MRGDERNQYFAGFAIDRWRFDRRMQGAVVHFAQFWDARVGFDLHLNQLHAPCRRQAVTRVAIHREVATKGATRICATLLMVPSLRQPRALSFAVLGIGTILLFVATYYFQEAISAFVCSCF